MLDLSGFSGFWVAKLDVQEGEIACACAIHIVEQLRPGTDRTNSLFRYKRLILKQQKHNYYYFQAIVHRGEHNYEYYISP